MTDLGFTWFKAYTPATLAIKLSITGKFILMVLFDWHIIDLYFKKLFSALS